MLNEKLSSLISLFVAATIVIMNFFPWYIITYEGKPKIQRWGKYLLFLCLLGLLGAIFLLIGVITI